MAGKENNALLKTKKWLSIFLVLSIVITLVSCKDKKEQEEVFEFEEEIQNLTELISGEDILRYPENYDGKQMNFFGYVLETTENTIVVTPNKPTEKDCASIKEGGAFARYVIRSRYQPIEIPYTNNQSPRLLIGDCVTFTGTVHAKLVDGEITREIDNITNMQIIEMKNK